MNIPTAPSLADIMDNNKTTQIMQDNQLNLSKFDLLVKQKELNPVVAKQLYDVLNTCHIVLLCDDSSSMNQTIAAEGNDPFAVKTSTRWYELKKLAAALIEIITIVNPNGLDIYFLNRAIAHNVSSLVGLSNIFNIPPNGGTNISYALNKIYDDKKETLTKDKQLLIVVITDGEPTDGTNNPRTNLYDTIRTITNRKNVHVSFAECTDQEEDMEYLDGWDKKLVNFDNTDDYREELRRVKAVNGINFKFDYTDYVIKILLATFIRSYFNLDQVDSTKNIPIDDCDCCQIL